MVDSDIEELLDPPPTHRSVTLTKRQRYDFPNMVSFMQPTSDDNLAYAIYGPPVTKEETNQRITEWHKKKTTKEELAKTRKDIKAGKVKKIESYFKKQGNKKGKNKKQG